MFKSFRPLYFILLSVLISFIDPSVSFGLILGYLFIMANMKPDQSLLYDLDHLDKKNPIVSYFEKHFDYKYKN